MKKILAVFVMLALVITAYGAIADPGKIIHQSQDFNTSVDVVRDTNPGPGPSVPRDVTPYVIVQGMSMPLPGSGNHHADNHFVWILTDDDHTADWTQINPTINGQVCRTVWAVVDDDMGLDNIRNVIYQVQYPDVCNYCGCSKGKVDLTRETRDNWIRAAFEGAYVADLISKNDRDALEYNLITQGNWSIWKGELCLDYCEPAGRWYLFVWAEDFSNNWKNMVCIPFDYVAVAAMYTDFTSIDYGPVAPGRTKRIEGDKDTGTPNRPTLKNIGNTRIVIQIKSDPMTLEQNEITKFDFQFKTEEKDYYVNDGWVTMQDYLCLCNTEKLDLSIHPGDLLPQGTYTGKLYLHIEDPGWDYCDDDPGPCYNDTYKRPTCPCVMWI
jgi:hypothetical protein